MMMKILSNTPSGYENFALNSNAKEKAAKINYELWNRKGWSKLSSSMRL